TRAGVPRGRASWREPSSDRRQLWLRTADIFRLTTSLAWRLHSGEWRCLPSTLPAWVGIRARADRADVWLLAVHPWRGRGRENPRAAWGAVSSKRHDALFRYPRGSSPACAECDLRRR